MSWFKVDDKLWGHPKWLATPVRSRGLWVTAGSWSADQEQDGNVPRHVLPILGGTVRDAAGLVAAGLWTATDTGWRFHGWAEFQPTREQKEAERSAARERMRAARERKAALRSEDVRPNISEVTDEFGRSSEDVRSTPTRPDPTRSSKEEVTTLLDKSSEPNGFAQFYEAYPRKAGRKAAAEKFKIALRATDAETLIEAAKRYAADPNQPSDRSKIPHPATWLHQGRWDDEPLPERRDDADKAFSLDHRFTGSELEKLLGMDVWCAPAPPPGMGDAEGWEWQRDRILEHAEERQQQARARMGRSA